ncbi:hypothetical protein FIV42_16955 [Persicimonas caeni]|jgi:hypothetical protein|uniref:Uncharacterized protein n=1 Tax=Persicimonas caeni TaxID=2292766 RepID=A0A4Y6PVM8_PERCE|nr:hypothetical protein [Persicimonas caeni]QDG52368.1 hypothetical protein FIV42_16955 [Persicimonas caeni]QED33590.1 hypothetical protein FRD00_16950 [Persicimonas caeni]
MSNNYKPDPFRDLFDDNELSSLFDDEEEDLATGEDFEEEDPYKCPGCGGKGKYVGLFEIEDPCQDCGGTGTVRPPSSNDDRPRFPKAGS